jgi:hypothetical protein
VCVCVCVCVYIYMYIYICIRIYIHTYVLCEGVILTFKIHIMYISQDSKTF